MYLLLKNKGIMEHEKTFFLKSGATFSSLKELAHHLRQMPVDVYEHHVNEHKNDFAQWAKHSLGEHDLHDKIQGKISKLELELKVLRHTLSQLEEEMKETAVKVNSTQTKKTVKKATTKKTTKKVAKKTTKKPSKTSSSSKK